MSLPAPVSIIPDFHLLCPVCSAMPFPSLICTNCDGLLKKTPKPKKKLVQGGLR